MTRASNSFSLTRLTLKNNKKKTKKRQKIIKTKKPKPNISNSKQRRPFMGHP
jgi:hypothetical protein